MLFKELQKTTLMLSYFIIFGQAMPLNKHLESRNLAFDYNSQKIRGVNLGGWLVLEPWITPSIFDSAGDSAVDEWTLSANLGSTSSAQATLSRHWDSFYTEDDFNRIAQAGLNHVRIPVGYWAVAPLPGDPYVQGQLDVLDKAVDWARSAGLKVLVDLHGGKKPPGSQNGFDNSGHKDPINWQKGDTVKQTHDAFRGLVQRYAKHVDVVTAIEALNEPSIPGGVNQDQLKQYYRDTWGEIRDSSHNTAIIIHDGFEPVDSWNGFMSDSSGMSNVLVDTHHYEVFDETVLHKKNAGDYVSETCRFGLQHLQKVDKWTVIGEWSAALTDCAKYLNGKGIGARYDETYFYQHQGSSSDHTTTTTTTSSIGDCTGKVTGSVDGMPDTEKSNMRRFIEAQLDSFEMRATGWLFWTWKTEGAPGWDMQQLISAGVFPQPLTSRQYPNQCG